MKIQVHDHDDVTQEYNDIIRREKEFGIAGWVIALALIPLHFVGVAIAVYAAKWMFASSDQMTISILGAVAYGVAMLSCAAEKLYRKIRRIEMHALTLHSEILKVKENQES
jgi:undecaprenyl pyrophosphate phosphatase UppP